MSERDPGPNPFLRGLLGLTLGVGLGALVAMLVPRERTTTDTAAESD